MENLLKQWLKTQVTEKGSDIDIVVIRVKALELYDYIVTKEAEEESREDTPSTSGHGNNEARPTPSTSGLGSQEAGPTPSTSGHGSQEARPTPSTSGHGSREARPTISTCGHFIFNICLIVSELPAWRWQTTSTSASGCILKWKGNEY